jgi:hypothetical protein
MIRDLEREESRNEFLRNLFQWDLAVREFRKVETKRVVLGTPTEHDLRFHAICLHSLLALGHALVGQSEDFSKEELSHCNVDHRHILAYVEELELSFREYHHGFTEDELKAAQAKIFSVAA